MAFYRLGLRTSQQALSPAFRSNLRQFSSARRRYANVDHLPGSASTQGKPLVGAADNAFNRERAAVKAHAAATSDLWRRLSLYVVVPSIILASINAWNLWNEHWEHWEHLPPLEERIEYPYQNIRTKNFFWGDGDKTLFWNDKVNYHNKDKVA